MLLTLLGQTWRSVVSVIIAWATIIGLLVYWPEFLARVLRWAEGIRDFLIVMVGSEQLDNPVAEVLARAIITEHAVSTMLFFLFARVVVLTTVLYCWNLAIGKR